LINQFIKKIHQKILMVPFTHFQPLVGFSGGVFLAFVFPPLIDFFTFFPTLLAPEDDADDEELSGSRRRQRKWPMLTRRLATNALFVGIGILGSLAGLNSSIQSILATHS
jgi:hypothetical protein